MARARPLRSLELRDRRLSFFVGSLALVAAAGHLLILAFVAFAGVPTLVGFNIASILLYLVLYLSSRRGMYTLVLVVTMVEVLAHAAVATLILGWDSAFHLYILCLIPLLYYIDRWPLQARGVASVAVLLSYVVLAVVSDAAAVWAPPQPVAYLAVARYGNMVIAAAVLIALSGFYQAAVAHAEEHMHRYSRTLEELSLTDPLTGARNRRGSVAELERALGRSVRSGATVALLLIDLDHFKAVNDRYGHEAGDAALKAVAAATSSVLRGSDSFGRWGGEEFVVILPETDADGARGVAERICDAVRAIELAVEEHGTLTLTATIGVAVAEPAGQHQGFDEVSTALVAAADVALYEGKQAGRDRVVVASGSAPSAASVAAAKPDSQSPPTAAAL